MRRIDSSKELHEYLLELASDGNAERSRQKSQAAATQDSLRTKKGDGSDLEEADDEDDAPSDEAEEDAGDAESTEFSIDVPEPTRKEISSVSVGDVTKAINLIRAGKSTKDKDIQDQLRVYLTKLSKSEQQTMYAFLLAIAELLVLGELGADAPKPGKLGINIKATAKAASGKESPAAPKQQSGTEDSPIVVGEVADKTWEKIVFERCR